jgi:signal transduction histidine kinase
MTTNPTLFAPAEYSSPEESAAQHGTVAAHLLVVTLLDCFPESAMVLNKNRQIVLANDKLASLLGRSCESLIGMRPGEAIGCANASERSTGCGTTQFCRYCGAVNAILNSQSSAKPQVEECRIQCASGGQAAALDLRVWATPLVVGDEQFTVFALHDTTDEKRRKVLERMFFHDVLNTAGGLSGLLEILPDLPPDEAKETGEQAHSLAEQLIEEIQSQRDLVAAEDGELAVASTQINANALLERMAALYRHHCVAQGRTISVGKRGWPVLLESDARLLARVLGNLIKNALEASKKGQTITVWTEGGETPSFFIHNQAVMPEAVQCQMFQRSFTTKIGDGHGIGTYSVKLLTEMYLRGTVEFRSTKAEGTTFIIRLPQRL